MNNFSYKLIRSRRRTIGMEIRDGGLVVRAPYLMPKAAIDLFVSNNRRWIETHLAKAQAAANEPSGPLLNEQELDALHKQARQIIPQRVAFYAPQIGVTYGKITIRTQKTRWGSCSSKGNLNFNCLLMLTPPEVLDSVVVHELCHRKEMNHSRRFYAEVLRVYPDYHKWNRWLKDNGTALMNRVPRD